jgi:hypothetical protein
MNFPLPRSPVRDLLTPTVMDFCRPDSRENRLTQVGADDSYCEPTHEEKS